MSKVRSAIHDIYNSGLELVEKRKPRGKPATYKDLAKINFEPWEEEGVKELAPSSDMMKELGFYSRCACAILMRSKAELIESYKTLGPKATDELMAHLADTREKMKALAKTMDVAYMRLLGAASAHVVAGVKSTRHAARSTRA